MASKRKAAPAPLLCQIGPPKHCPDPARAHFPEGIRLAACEALAYVVDESKLVPIELKGHYTLESLGVSAADEQKAYRRFCVLVEAQGFDPEWLKRLTMPYWRTCALRYFARHIKQGSAVSTLVSRRRAKLTDAELLEAATILGTPIHLPDGSWRHWRNVVECAETAHSKQARFTQLLQKSGVLPETFAEHMLSKCGRTLHKVKADKTSKLTPETLKQRQQAAAIWAGREPWRWRLSQTRARALKVATSDVSHPAVRQEDKTPVYWDWRYYEDFSFMLDATSFEDKEGPSHHAERVFALKGKTWPPEQHKKDKSVGDTNSLMVYCVIHKHAGLVAGPYLMYTGSKEARGAAAYGKHSRGFRCWCGPLVKCSVASDGCVDNSMQSTCRCCAGTTSSRRSTLMLWSARAGTLARILVLTR